MMGVVHDALRRDLCRLQSVFASPTDLEPGSVRRHALCDHIEWMMDFLHRHHRGEDAGLWPLLLARAPETSPLVTDLERDHESIEPAMQQLLDEVSRYRDDAVNQRRVADALNALSDVLLPHLRREEDDAMPLVSAHVTNREWRAWDKQHNIRGKSLKQLAMDGHWLMDQLDAERYRLLVHLVPPPVRLVIVKGFARSYRQACSARWTPDVAVSPLPASA